MANYTIKIKYPAGYVYCKTVEANDIEHANRIANEIKTERERVGFSGRPICKVIQIVEQPSPTTAEKLLLVVDKRIDTLEQVIQSAIQWGIHVSDSLMQTVKDDISVCNFWKTTINEVATSFGVEDNDANT